MENRELENRVVRYWTVRSHDFGTIRKNELGNAMGRRWLAELEAGLPQGGPLRILDIGTGTGFFAILMARLGHRVTGIDLTPAMLEEASATAAGLGLDIDFRQMDAQQLDFPENTFDALVSRNLTWTLPEPENECESVICAMAGSSPCRAPAEEGARIMELIDLIYGASGQWIA